jgi:hypothetical protein
MKHRQAQMGHVQDIGSVQPAMIPGVVDGLVTTSLAPDGSVSFHVIIGASRGQVEECDHIEFILSPEHAKMFGETLLGKRRQPASSVLYETPSVPCCIGVRLNPASRISGPAPDLI